MRRNQNFRLNDFFFSPSPFPLFFSFAAVIGLLMGLLTVKKLLREHHRDTGAVFTMEKPCVVAGNFALSFSLNFLSIFVHISDAIRPSTLIWASWERSFPPAEVEYR